MEHGQRTHDGVTVLELRGAIDVAQAYQLRDTLGPMIDGPSAKVLLDLAEVTLIDSSGIGVFVTAHRRAVEVGSGLVLARPSGSVERVFTLTRTDQLLRIVPTLEDGFAALAQG